MNLLEEIDKLPKKIELYLNKAKIAQEEWTKNNNNNKISLINDCINLEKIVENTSKISQIKLDKLTIRVNFDEDKILQSI